MSFSINCIDFPITQSTMIIYDSRSLIDAQSVVELSKPIVALIVFLAHFLASLVTKTISSYMII
jgi:hypothetical protein